MADLPQPAAPNMVSFTLDSAYAHELLAPRSRRMMPGVAPFDRVQVVIDHSIPLDRPHRSRRSAR